MANVIVYDPSDPDVANRVTEFHPSVHSPDYDAETNKLINPDLSALWTAPNTFIVPREHWKWNGGELVVEMTSAEKDLVSLDAAKVAKRQAINNYRDYKLYVLKYNWPADSNNYDMDPTSQFKIAATLAYINAGNTLPGDFKWRDADNVDQAFTTQQFKDFGSDAWDRAENMHEVTKVHKDAVDALTTIATVDAYDYTTETPSWPA